MYGWGVRRDVEKGLEIKSGNNKIKTRVGVGIDGKVNI